LKKTLFSLAFLAVSGVYVAAANHFFSPAEEETTATVALPAARVGAKPSVRPRGSSRYINSQALPLLKQEVMAADSANVDTISGATLTSEAYIRSLSSALQQAGAANA
jgi:uncharacterized protein with FMN-binding domain